MSALLEMFWEQLWKVIKKDGVCVCVCLSLHVSGRVFGGMGFCASGGVVWESPCSCLIGLTHTQVINQECISTSER